MIYGIDIINPMKYLIFFILSILFLSLVIRIVVRTVLEVYYEQKQKYIIKMRKTKQTKEK